MSSEHGAGREPGTGVEQTASGDHDHRSDEDWFEAVFTDHAEAVRRYFLRRGPADDADDLAADVLATAWRRRDDVPRGHELPWLYKTAGYVLANYRRKNRAEPIDVTEQIIAHPGADPADEATDTHMLGVVLKQLTDREREILLLNAWEGLSGDELADALGISRGGAAAALSRARARLRELWEAGP